MAEVGRAITSMLELEPLLTEVVALIQKRFGYPFVHVFTVQQGRRKVVYQAGSGSRSKVLQPNGLEYDLDAPHGIIPWVARNGATLIANDVSQEPRYRPSELLPDDTCAELAVPFLYGGEILGVLDVQSDHCNAFNDDDRFLFEALADNISIAIHNAILYRSEQWRRQVAESLRDVASLLSSNAALDKVLDAILTELRRNLACESAAIWLLEGESPQAEQAPDAHLILAAAQGVEGDAIAKAMQARPEASARLAETLHADHPIVRAAGNPYGPLGAAMAYPPEYSSIAAPLHVGERALGVLALAHRTPDRYGGEARSMTAAFASYAAVAIENARLFESAQEQAWVSTVMLQVAEATQALTTIDELFSTVVRLTPLLVGVKGCALFAWDAAEEAFLLNAVYGMGRAHAGEVEQRAVPLGEMTAFNSMYFTKAPVVIHDPLKDLPSLQDLVPTPGADELVLLPLLARGEVLGAFLVEYHGDSSQSGGQRGLDDERLAIIQGITRQTAIAVENIRLLEARQEEAYVTAVLLQVAQAVVSANELEDILASIVHIMPILVGIDCCIIYLWDSARSVFRPAQVYTGHWKSEDDLMAQSFAPEEYPLLSQVLKTDEFLIFPLSDPPEAPTEWQRLQPPESDPEQSTLLRVKNPLLMAFPLSVKGDVFGVMLTQESGTARSFREKRLEIVKGIAQQAALAIQNDRFQREMIDRERLEREFQLARDIQKTFLPDRLPSPAGWNLDSRWQPARQVGGDFYDLIKLSGGRMGLVIADVSDKGLPAALYMTVTRTLIRAAVKGEASPAKALMRVNELLLADTQNGMFITAFYAILALKTGQLIYANAGHNLPLLLRRGAEKVERLAKGGMALGALEHIRLQDHSLALEPGDGLLLYTDGVTEAFAPDGDLYGEERLMQVVAATRNSSASALLDAVEASLKDFRKGEPQSDDVTLVAVRRLPSAQK